MALQLHWEEEAYVEPIVIEPVLCSLVPVAVVAVLGLDKHRVVVWEG